MTALPALIDIHDRPVPLDSQLGSGGEGVVFTLSNNSKQVAKVYHRLPSDQTFEKIKTMVHLANPQLLTLAAWPTALLYHARTRQAAGFLMPRLSDCQPIQHLYNPVRRLQFYPQVVWNFQVRAAMNLAAAFEEVHKAGCLVGDVNQSNVQVSPQALVRLIDCDSFQVVLNGKAFLCEVGVAHYIPPELQGKSLRNLVRTENHDRFGLAVLIYQLLFVGRHPYSGIYSGVGDPSFEQLIAEYRFAQGPAAHSWSMAPPPHTPSFADIPPELGNLFRRAFERGSETGSRPRPTEWFAALQRLENSLVECAIDPGHKYWRGAQSCVWCRLADHGGPEYYFGAAGGVGTFCVDEVKLKETLRRLSACGPFDFPYDRRRFKPSRLLEPNPLPNGVEEHSSIVIILGVAIGLCVLTLPLGLLHGAIFFAGLLGALVFGVWLIIHLSISPWHCEHRRRRKVYQDAQSYLNTFEEKWRNTVDQYKKRRSQYTHIVHNLISQCRGLAAQYQVEVQQLKENAEAMARLRYLRLHLIADADIPKIGAGRKQTLADNGIFTAADIDDYTISGIKGFGDVLTGNLMVWKDEVLQHFRFDPKTAVSPAAQRTVTVKFRNVQQQLINKLIQQMDQLESLTPACRLELQTFFPELQQAVFACEQAEIDLHFAYRKQKRMFFVG